MDIKLQIFKMGSGRGSSFAERFHFVVVDLDKSKNYPANYVCILPLELNGKKPSTFSTIFGDKSLNLAKKLLQNSLETTNDAEKKVEIARRLRRLSDKLTECSS